MWLVVKVYLAAGAAVVLALGAAFLVLFALAILLPRRRPRQITPQEWADELEAHLLGFEGDYDWDDTISEELGDPSLNRLRCTLAPDFNRLDTAEKTEEFRQIIEALRRGEIPDRR